MVPLLINLVITHIIRRYSEMNINASHLKYKDLRGAKMKTFFLCLHHTIRATNR